MRFPRGSSIAVGLFVGAVIGIFLDDAVRFIFLGTLFGIIGEMANKEPQ